MGFGSASSSQDDRDEDDEDEYEEEGQGNRLLGFMFGNVDGAGDLDVDYLDEDAKEHLAALADKLGSSLTEIDLSVKSSQASAYAPEEDYDEKAEDAVDYEDIDEQYEGPEIQATTEEDYLLSKKDYFASEVPVADLDRKTSVFDDDNYDEDEEEEVVDTKQKTVDTTNVEVHNIPSPGKQVDTHPEISEADIFPGEKPVDALPVISKEELYQRDTPSDTAPRLSVEDIYHRDDQPSSHAPESVTDLEEEEPEVVKELAENVNPLPVLYKEDGTVILRFSEIFGNYEPLRRERKERRYSVLKEKYTALDTSSIVEEDDEEFLKGHDQGFYFSNHAHGIEDDFLQTMDKGPDSPNSDFSEAANKAFVSAEPLKENMNSDLSLEWTSSLSPKIFYPLDQQNWEDQIIWDSSPAHSDITAESVETSGPESEEVLSIQTNMEIGTKNVEPASNIKSVKSDNDLYRHKCPIFLEPFISNEVLSREKELASKSIYHPQLLRLESRLEHTNNWHDKKVEVVSAINRFNNLIMQNRDLVEGSWLDRILWEPQQYFIRPKLILDLQDEHMLFEVLDDENGEHLRLHAGAMVIARSVKSEDGGDISRPHGHVDPFSAKFNIANDKFYPNRKISQQLKSHSKKRAAHGVKVLHSVPALKLQTVKPKLSNKDIANFHRPKALWYPHDNEVALKEQGQLTSQGPMKIILKSLGGKGSKLHVEAEETVSSLKEKASKKLDYKPLEPVKIFYLGRELENDTSLAAQNVRPNSLLHLVRTNVYMWPRAQKVPGENKSLRPPGAFKKKSDLSVKDGHVFLMEYCEERPLLLSNVGMGARLCTYYQKSSPDDQTGALVKNGNNSLGSLFVLDPADKSPFLGDVRPGSSQSSLETNMYRAPIYPHKVSSADYLLVRSPKGKLSIRRIDRLNVVGQQEPHIEVLAPGSKGLQAYTMNRLLVYMYREFRTIQKRGSIPCIRADELSAQFPAMSEPFLRKRLKHCADMQRGTNGHQFWVMRRNFRIPLEEELRRMVTPENVCAYESMQAGQHRLKRLGIHRLTQSAALSSAMNQLPDEAITLAAASHIERELQITPWSLSSNFVACTSQGRENIERLEISGVGDPSGRGLCFSFVRATPKVAPVSSAMVKQRTVTINRGGSTVTGTDADLRRLSMEAARELLLKFNVPEEQIAKQTRWHRIAMIRKLSSEQTTNMVDPATVSKYARGQRMSFLQLHQQTREKCQEIWDRQVQSLSVIDGDEYESDVEAHSDLDSFAGDLENFLDAEEVEEGEGGESDYHVSKSSKADGVKGLKMRRRPLLAQAEEEIEDEAAEAAELCRMLMDDDEAKLKKTKKTKAVMQGVGRIPSSQLKADAENIDRPKKTNVTPKKDANTIQPDKLLTFKEVTEPNKEEELFNKKGLSANVKGVKMNDIESKKVKILADGIQFVKEKKSARDKFICGACGQLGHMRTNKNCSKFREDSETQCEGIDLEKSTRSDGVDPSGQIHKKFSTKKLLPKNAVKVDQIEAPDDEKSSIKAKVLKVKCGSTDKITCISSRGPDAVVVSDAEPTPKVNKLIISKKVKTEDVQVGSSRTSIVIKPPVVTEKDQPRRIVIKRPKVVINLEDSSVNGDDGQEGRKMKKINELHLFEKQRLQEEEKIRQEKRWWEEEEEKKRIAEREEEEREIILYENQRRCLEEQERFAKIQEIQSYELAMKREREEEELQKAKKKKKNRGETSGGEYFGDVWPLRNDNRKQPERERIVKRERYDAEYAPPPPIKRRKGGEVGLANILEKIVETLKSNHAVSYLFLKPVTRKEAPDYLAIIKRPMDLSTIKEKVRRLEYRGRDEFRHDVWQITVNAMKYNTGRNPGIPPLAQQLLELCDFLLDDHAQELDEVEKGIKSDG